jgi:hypothetical protein
VVTGVTVYISLVWKIDGRHSLLPSVFSVALFLCIWTFQYQGTWWLLKQLSKSKLDWTVLFHRDSPYSCITWGMNRPIGGYSKRNSLTPSTRTIINFNQTAVIKKVTRSLAITGHVKVTLKKCKCVDSIQLAQDQMHFVNITNLHIPQKQRIFWSAQ